MPDFKREPLIFDFLGVDLVRPVTLVPQFAYPIATNIRCYSRGVIQSRPGFTNIAKANGAGGIGAHFVKRFNDPIAGTYEYVVGAGSALYAGTSDPLTSVDTGYTANTPQTAVVIAPVRTPRPWLYVADAGKLAKRKVGQSGMSTWGIPAPTSAPVISYGVPAYTTVSDMEATTNWTVAGTAGALTNPARVDATITKITYDSGSTGWASVQPSAYTNINEGMFLIFNASETAIVDQVFPAIPNTTIAAISYDSGSTGLCSIQLTATVGKKHIAKGSYITLGGSTEQVTVRDVIFGPDGVPSIRVSTANTHAAADTVTGLPSFRVYLAGTFSATQTIKSKCLQSTVTTGIGQIQLTQNTDMSNASSRPVHPEDDEIVLHVNIDNLANLTDCKLYFDVDASTNDFAHNYYFKALEPNDFVAVTKNTATTYTQRLTRLQKKLAKAIQKGNFDRQDRLRARIANVQTKLDALTDIPIEDQTTLGDSQWTVLRFKTKDLTHVGNDLSRSLANVAKIMVQFHVTASTVTQIDACWVGGTYGPDVGARGEEYRYIYRYRVRDTGVTSAWSPPTYSGLNAHRQRIAVATTSSANSDVDLVDVARIGGSLTEWRIVGNTTNGGTFNDDNSDSAIINAELADLNEFQPFCVADLPRTGTCNVRGVTVDRATGDNFNTSWTRFNLIIIGSTVYNMYGPPLSTTKLLLDQNAGSQSSVNFYIPNAIIAGQPLPSVFGPIGYGEAGLFIFGVGSTQQPGTLFWCNGNDPDLMMDGNQLDICSPSEPLVAGCVYNGRAFVWSTERMFQIFPAFSGGSVFNVQEVPNSRGMFGLVANTALCVGPKIWYRGKDGIYETEGGEPRNITDKLLYPLFPHDGQAGVSTNGYYPPDDTAPQNLEYYDGYVYYDFKDTNAQYVTWWYNVSTEAWGVDIPTQSAIKPVCHYGSEGTGQHALLCGAKDVNGDARLFTRSGTSDNGTAIAGQVRTGAFTAGDERAQKNFGDLLFDADPNNTTLSIVVGFNEYSATESTQTRTGSGRARTPTLEVQSGAGKIAYNEQIDVTWSSTSATPKLYGWEPAWTPKPEDTARRYTDWTDLGYRGPKFFHGIRLHADTSNSSRSLIIQTADGTNGAATTGATITVQHNGESIIDYDFATPFIGHLVRLAPQDATSWRLWEDYELKWDIDAPLVKTYVSQVTTNGMQGYMHLCDGYIAHISTANISLVLVLDGVSQSAITIAHGSGVFTKTYFRYPAKKYKTVQYQLTSASNFRLYKNDCEMRFKPWGSDGAYQVIKPFGEVSYNEGPTI